MTERSAPAPTGPSAATLPWRLMDVIDFEYLLEADHALETVALERRDRTLYRERILPTFSPPPTAPPSRPGLFRAWLELRRRADRTGAPWPGEVFTTAQRWLSKWMTGLGLLLGGGVAAQLLRYDGVQPVNVAAYLGWLVLVQIGLVTLALVLLLWRSGTRHGLEWSLPTSLIRWAWTALTRRMADVVLARVPAEQRTSWQAFLGSALAHLRIHGSLLAWPMITLLQWFGICFNIGALGVTLALVTFSDRAFGWQSAIQFSPEQVHRWTSLLALPWSWMDGLAQAAPTLGQIEGSRIVLKDGIRQLATENLVAWWPFLSCALLVYGLLPRLVLWIGSRICTRRALDSLRLDHVACDRLYERLLGEDLMTLGEGQQPEPRPLPLPDAPDAIPKSGQPAQELSNRAAILFLEPELRAALQEGPLRDRIQAALHLEVAHLVPTGLTPSELEETFRRSPGWRWLDGQPKALVLLEAWEPPIAENLGALRLLRHLLGPAARISVLLVGRPQAGNSLTAVRPEDWQNWERQTMALADPLLRLEPLVSPHA